MGLIDEYIAHGWSVTPIKKGSKNPGIQAWDRRNSALKKEADLLPGYTGVGLMHAYSGTCSLDVDDWDLTKARGIDLDALFNAPDAVQIVSGKSGHGKLLYRMPFGVLPTKKFTEEVINQSTGKSNRVTVFELRCGTLDGTTVQCVLPPSIHPDTGLPYTWRGDWRKLPWLPPSLLQLWEDAIKDIRPPSEGGVDSSWEEIQDAISYIDPSCPRDEWIRVGMALQGEGEKTYNPEQAFRIWDEWSKPSPKYRPREMRSQWHSFRTTKNVSVTLGTLFKYARAGGWPGKRVDASTLFGPTTKPIPPTDIVSLLRPTPPDIDLDLFPTVLARRAQEVSESVGCDPLVPLWAGLGAVCGAIDARTRLELAPGFRVPPVLWLMTIGDPGDKKSPGSTPMIDPLTDIEASDKPRYAREVQAWDISEAAWSANKAATLKYVATAEGLLDPSQAPPHPGDKPKMPVPLKITVSDVTSQKLIHLAAERPRGLLCYLDEMNGWISKLTSRASGEDRSAWVVSYESRRYEMDRVQNGSIHAENLAISIYGNCQPRVLEDNYNSLTQDGLLQRFIPAILRHDQTRLSQPVPAMFSSAHAWDNLLRQTYALQPTTYRLTPEAYACFRRFQEWYEDRKQKERLVKASQTYMTAFGKLEGLVGRLALVFHAMENPFVMEVPASVVERVIRLVRSYVIPAYRYLYDRDETSSTTFDLWVMEHVIHHADSPSILMRDIKRSARRQWELNNVKHPQEQSQWILNAMGLLEKPEDPGNGWVIRADDGTQEGKGVAEWLINPYIKTIFAEHRLAVIRAKVERDEDLLSKFGIDHVRGTTVHGADLLEQM